MIFSSAKETQPSEVNGKYVTEEYSNLLLLYIIRELFQIQTQYKADYGDMIICFDDWKKDYWRKDVYPGYKAHRAGVRNKNKINYTEVYEHVNELVQQLENNLPWKCVTVNKAEADDTILILSRKFSVNEKVLIYSPDKDFIQAQRFTNNVDQYSALTRKWLKPEHKTDSMDDWIQEHVMLGDASDGVPKVVQHCEFTDVFKDHLKNNLIDSKFWNVKEFKYGHKDVVLPVEVKLNVMKSFTAKKYNRNNDVIGPDIYKDVRFGVSTLKKAIKEHKSLDNFLLSHPMYKEHYDRNFTLVMEEGIPLSIKNDTFLNLKEAKCDYNTNKFREYLHEHMLFDIEHMLSRVFTSEVLTVENCNW